MNRVQILIPSLNPDEKLIKTILEISRIMSNDIIVINDGSNTTYDEIFDQILKIPHCYIIKHAVNQGKGRALKSGFNYVLNNYPDTIGVVTVDGDGQHLNKDILTCIHNLEQNSASLILGCRDFSLANIPFKSRFGNKLTRQIMKYLCGINIPDTQTGLRAIPKNFMETLLNIPGERFEFETNMLIETKNSNIKIITVPIETVYIEENKTSHFNPLIDSFKIYMVFLRYVFSSLISFIIDILLFSLFISILKPLNIVYYIYISTFIARFISSIVNYNINKKTVFNDLHKNNMSAIKYIILCLLQLSISAFLVQFIFNILYINESFIKIIVDTLLFLLSFIIQRDWVFNKGK